MGLKGDKNIQINLAGKSKNSLKKIVVQSVYYCENKVKDSSFKLKESAFGAEESAKRVPGRNNSNSALLAGLTRGV